MKKFETPLDPNINSLANSLAFLPEIPEKICFFDIETTGLSPKISSLYLIGAAIWENSHFRLFQWFADDYVSEKEILISFSEFSAPFTTFVHYNGTTFDIPYLEKKYSEYNLASPFTEKKSLDLFRSLPKNKTFFPVKNRKLATMEKLLSFVREDTFTGKDCIRLYTDYMKKKYSKDASTDLLMKKLLLHNHDDLLGTILCSQLLSYCPNTGVPFAMENCHAETVLSETGENFLQIHAETTGGYFPFDFETSAADITGEKGILYRYDTHSLTVLVPLYPGEFYHFYADYKNYYYLPKEDMAIHKSVGSYVDKEYRRQATASTCYTKKNSCFFPLPATFDETIPLFRENYKSRKRFMDVDNALSLSQRQLAGLLYAFVSTA